jgi:hypothetical protein
MEFQVAGDLHFTPNSRITDFSTLLPPTKPFLITTGDIVQPSSEACYVFYTHCAKNWEKTYIVMGNQEYECRHKIFQQTMQKQFSLMLQLIAHINSEVGCERLICIHNTFVDLPEHSLRIAGLTLWANGTHRPFLKKDMREQSTQYTNDIYRGRSLIDSWIPLNYTSIPASYSSISNEDLIELQKKDIEFLDRMIHETVEKGYKLLVCSHYVPTVLIKTDNEHHIEFFSRDIREKIQSPIIAWVCGHVHLEQTVVINNIPIYVNVPSIVL